MVNSVMMGCRFCSPKLPVEGRMAPQRDPGANPWSLQIRMLLDKRDLAVVIKFMVLIKGRLSQILGGPYLIT